MFVCEPLFSIKTKKKFGYIWKSYSSQKVNNQAKIHLNLVNLHALEGTRTTIC